MYNGGRTRGRRRLGSSAGDGRGTPFGPKDFCTHNCAETFHLRFFPFFTRRHLGMADVGCEKEMPGSAWEVCKLCSVCIFRKTPKGHRRATDSEGPPAKKSNRKCQENAGRMHPQTGKKRFNVLRLRAHVCVRMIIHRYTFNGCHRKKLAFLSASTVAIHCSLSSLGL